MIIRRKKLLAVLILLPVFMIAGYDFLQILSPNPIFGNLVFKFVFYSLCLLLALAFTLFIIRGIGKHIYSRQQQTIEESSKLLLDNIKDYAIFLLDENGKVASWNRGAEQIKGYKESEILGSPLDIFYTEADKKNKIPSRNLQHAKKSGHYEDEGWRVRKDGTKFWANVIFSSLHDKRGRFSGYAKITRDISLRKEAEEKVAFLSRQINQSWDAIYFADVKRKIRSWNKGAERLYGFAEEEVIGKDPNEFLQPDIKEKEIDPAIRELSTHDYWVGELKRKTRQGKLIDVHTSTTTIRDSEKNITGYVSVSIDVTERVKLRKQVDYLAGLVDQSTDAIISAGPDGAIISWNKGAQKLYGYSKEETIGRKITELNIISPTDHQTIALFDTISIKTNWQVDMGFLHRDGSSFFGAVNASAVKDQTGKFTAVVFTVKDISIRKQLEERLKEYNAVLEDKITERTKEIYKTERRFRSLIENNYDIISLMDESFRIIYRSPSAFRITGWTNEELKDSNGMVNIHPDDQEKAASLISELTANPGKPIYCLFRNMHKNGQYLWLEGVATNLLYDENVKAIIFNFRDVTERIEAQTKLIASEERFRSIIEQYPSPVSRYLQDGSFISANPAWETMWEDKIENAVGYNIRKDPQLISSGLAVYIEQAFAGNISSSDVYLYDPALIGKSGRKRWIQLLMYPLKDSTGNILEVIVITLDVTARKEAEENLAYSEKRFRTMIENISDAIVLNHPDSTIIYQSPSVTRILGYSPEERAGKKVTDYVHPENKKDFEQLSRQLEKNPSTPLPFQYRFFHKKGYYIWLEGVVTNLLHDPAVNAYVANYRDITERKEAEDALSRSEELYRNLFNNMLHGFSYCKAIFDKQELKDYIYLAVNSEYESLTGLKNITGKKMSEVIPDLLKSDPGLAEIITKVCLFGESYKFETYIAPLDKWFSVSLYCPEKGYFVSLADNITERKNTEQKIQKLNTELENRVIRRTEQLKKSNEELEAFSYSISHDLRAPLRAIVGFTAILEEDYSSKLDDEARRLTGVIKTNTLKMGNLIDDLLSFSRTGRHNMEKITLDTNEMIRQALADLDLKNSSHPVEWIIPTLQPSFGDNNMLRQVWINLISNAIKYSGQNQKPRIEIGSYLQRNQPVFFIKDNGVGFDQQYADKLFKVFQRLHSSHEFEGTGIGLAIVEKVISKHGGRVWAESSVNKGANFYFTLPVEEEIDRE